MGLVPELETSCLCCTLKTGSFVAAWFLLIGSSVQVGYYAFLLDHMHPQKMCLDYKTVRVQVTPPPHLYDEYYDRLSGRVPSLYSPYYREYGPYRRRLIFQYHEDRRVTYLRPCPREYKPFDADAGMLDFELRVNADRTVLYVNIVIWVTLMATTIPLMVAVYKESTNLLEAWLAAEGVLLTLATAAAVATAVFMLQTVPVQIGIVTLFNMAIHLGIDIYLMMVVENYRRGLRKKEGANGDSQDEQMVQVVV